MARDWQVIIAGAGPTGLTLAAELAGAGIRCLVVERRAEPSPHSRAFTMMSYTLELLDMRGQADRMVQRGLPSRYGPFGDGKRYLDFGRLDSRFSYLLLLPQRETEVVLERYAREAGAEVMREARVAAVEQDDDGVTVHIEDGKRVWSERALYLAACDGAHSTVRGLTGIAFEGKGYECSLVIADVHLDRPPNPAVHARISKRGMAAVFPFPDELFRVIVLDHERMAVPVSEPVTLMELQESVGALLGTDVGIRDPVWLSRFRSEQRLAAQYRKGRVFLAGDAAHTHIPSGGQGLQIGIQDAFNLGWKLAAQIQGWAPNDLLDSYEKERRPVAAETLRQTDINFRYETSRSPWVAAARRVAMELMQLKSVQKSIIDNFAGFKLRYAQPRGASPHRLTGRRIPETIILDRQNESGRVHELLRARQFVLLDQTSQSVFAAHIGTRWRGRLAMACGKASRVDLPAGVLIRPDGIVAWAGSQQKMADLERALVQWCGEPVSSSSTTFAGIENVPTPGKISSPAVF